MTFKKEFFSLLFFLNFTFPRDAGILKAPDKIDPQELQQKALMNSLPMKWSKKVPGENTEVSLSFKHQKGKAIMTVEIEGEFPLFLEKYKNQFQLKEQNGQKTWLFIYGAPPLPDINLLPSSSSLEEEMGIIHPPRKLDQTQAIKVTIDEVATLIATKKCVFYTGAGLSSPVVMTMRELMQRLGFSQQEKFREVFIQALKNPDHRVQVMEEFYHTCLFGKPTLAHLAVKSILLQKNWGLMTENLDFLHQCTGIKPLTHEGKDWIRGNISIEDLKKIDYVITIGLAGDESGFLSWYKHHNPQAKIIAINLNQPSYLDNQDYLVEGDSQELLPRLQQKLLA